VARHRSIEWRPGYTNIGSPGRLKDFFVWIDDTREQRVSAAAAQIRGRLTGTSKL
jgi:hypothetical protein